MCHRASATVLQLVRLVTAGLRDQLASAFFAPVAVLLSCPVKHHSVPRPSVDADASRAPTAVHRRLTAGRISGVLEWPEGDTGPLVNDFLVAETALRNRLLTSEAVSVKFN